MIKKRYIVDTTFYDYFGGQKDRSEKFDNLSDAWKYYTNECKRQFRYDDAFYSVRGIWCAGFHYEKDSVVRPHARSKREWEIICENRRHEEELKRRNDEWNDETFQAELEKILVENGFEVIDCKDIEVEDGPVLDFDAEEIEFLRSLWK